MTILDWLKHSTTVFGAQAPLWTFLAIGVGVVVEYLLGRFAPTKCASLIALIATGLRFLLTPLGRVPGIGPMVLHALENVAGVDLDGDGSIGAAMDRASQIAVAAEKAEGLPKGTVTKLPPGGGAAVLLLVGLLSFGSLGCAAVVSQLPAIIAYVQDAEIIVSTIQAVMNNVWVNHPGDPNQAIVNAAIAKVDTVLDVVNRLAQGGEAINKAQLDAAFADFEGAFNDLMSLVGPYGIKVGDVPKATRGAGGVLIVPRPTMLTVRQ